MKQNASGLGLGIMFETIAISARNHLLAAIQATVLFVQLLFLEIEL